MSNENKRGVVLLSNLDHDGMTFPQGTEFDFGDDEFEAALVAAGVAKWAKGPVPEAVTKAQLLEAIAHSGMRPVFDSVFADNPRHAQLFDLAIDVRRYAPVVADLATAAEKSEAEIDDLFRLAATFNL